MTEPARSAPLAGGNPHLKHLRRLVRSRRARSAAALFVLEGPHLVRDALARRDPVDVVYAGEEVEPEALATLADLCRGAGVDLRIVARGVLPRAADTMSSRSVLAVVRGGARPLADLERDRPAGALLVLVGVADPGNAGTLVRSALGSGCCGVLACGPTADVFGPKAVRASAGAVPRLPVWWSPEPAEAIGCLRRLGRRIVATDPRGEALLHHADLGGDVALLVGSEAHGLGDALIAAADLRVAVPLEGGLESLNAAVAGSLVCFEALRNRLDAGAGDGQGERL